MFLGLHCSLINTKAPVCVRTVGIIRQIPRVICCCVGQIVHCTRFIFDVSLRSTVQRDCKCLSLLFALTF